MYIRHQPWFKDRRYTEVWTSEDGKSWHMTHMEGPGKERTIEQALDSVEDALNMTPKELARCIERGTHKRDRQEVCVECGYGEPYEESEECKDCGSKGDCHHRGGGEWTIIVDALGGYQTNPLNYGRRTELIRVVQKKD